MSPTLKPSPSDLDAIIKAGGPTKRSRLWLIAAFVTIAVASSVWIWSAQKAKARASESSYATVDLHRGEISLTITATGNLEPTNKVTIGSELSGTTLEVYVDTNAHVSKGQPLAKLDTSKLTQQTESSRAILNSAKARVTQANATVKQSDAGLARQQELHRLSGGKVPSQSDLEIAIATADRARADLLSAEASVGEAEAAVRINENDLAKALIKSPIDGIVLKRSIEPGQTVAASFTAPELFVVAEKLEHMKLKIAIAESDIGRVSGDQKANFTVDAWPNRTYTAKVLKVSYGSSVADNVVTYQADLEVANDDLTLRPGMTATADIRVAEATNVLLVPTAALRFDPVASAAALAATKQAAAKNIFSGPPKNVGKPPAPAEMPEKLHPGSARIWVLRKGQPEAIMVKLGLSDGRFTEIAGEGLSTESAA